MADSAAGLLGGRYRVLGTLGKGSMGLVFMAHDPVLDRRVAIKQMAAEIADNQELRQRFYVEARAAARLNHPNIITIHELQESGGEIFMIMELLEGRPLSSLVDSRPVPLSLEATLDVMAQVCDGLDYAHQKAIVHRDIKPANLFLTTSGAVKILDFGIARLGTLQMTATGALIGTPDYMAPEQIRGDQIDRRTDLWAVGAVLYQLLSGTRPFEGRPLAKLLSAISQTPHIPLQQRAPAVPRSVSDLVDRLLSKPREGRPASAGLVRDELRAILGRESSSSTRAMLAQEGNDETLLLSVQAPASPAVNAVEAVPPPTPPASPSPQAAPASAPRPKSSRRLVVAAVAALLVIFAVAALGSAAWWRLRARTSRADAGQQASAGLAASAAARTVPEPLEEAVPSLPPTPPVGDAAGRPAPATGQAAPSPAAEVGRPPERLPAAPQAADPAAPQRGAVAVSQRTSVGQAGQPPIETGVLARPAERQAVTQETVESLAGRQSGQSYDASTAPSVQAAIARINFVLEQYVKALVNADENALREYRSVVSPEENALMRAQQLRLRLEEVRVEVNGSEATARCRRKVQGISATGAPFQEDAPAVYRLVRRPAGWVITEVR